MSGGIPWIIYVLTVGAVTGFFALFALMMLTYVRRTWQQIRRDDAEAGEDGLLDAVDRLETQLRIVNDRLERLERKRLDGR